MPLLFLRLPFLHVKAITLWFLVLYKGDLDETTRRHETIHFRQYNELFLFGFLVVYAWDFTRAWLKRGLRPSEFWNATTTVSGADKMELLNGTNTSAATEGIPTTTDSCVAVRRTRTPRPSNRMEI